MTADAANPLLADWSTPFGLPPFAALTPAHFPPAFEAGIAAHRTEIAAIADNPDAPAFANTIRALDDAGRKLSRVASVFFNLTGTDTNDELQAIQRDMAPKLAAHGNEITSNPRLFARIDAVYKARHDVSLTPEQLRLVERTHLSFVRAGAALAPDDKKRLGEIKQRLATLGTRFTQNVLADEKSYELPLTKPDDLAGLPDFLVDASRSAARQRKSEAAHVVTLSRSLIEPFLTFSSRRDLRETAFKAWMARGRNGGKTDNMDIIAETLTLRRERARLLGYTTFADYKLDDSMAKSPAAVKKLLDDVWHPALTKAAHERNRLRDVAVAEGMNAPLAPWDWRYYAEKVRKADYDLDEAETKPYFALDRMIEAAFATATRLFGVTFTPCQDVPVYHPDVRAWEVHDRTGAHLGIFLGDYFARPSKKSGAWCTSFRRQERLAGDIRPIISNVCNFAKPEPGSPALLSFDDARTLFHEFGHALHGLLSNVTYPSLAGTSVSRDFVELPSQLFERWLDTTEILDTYARHYKTGEAMPKSLLAKLQAARTFNQGFATVEYIASAMVDIAFHSEDYTPGTDPLVFEADVLARIGMPNEIAMRHATPHFAHIFSGDSYSAGYYSYMWSEVLDADAFAAFSETGNVFDPSTADRLEKFIYSAGGLRDEKDAYIAFRGTLPAVDGLLKRRGLVAPAA